MIDNTIAAPRRGGHHPDCREPFTITGPDAFLFFPKPARSIRQPARARSACLEQRLEQAAGQGVQTILVRAGDFFGPGAGNNWFAQALVKPASASAPSRCRAGAVRATAGPIYRMWRKVLPVFWTCVKACPVWPGFICAGVYDADGLVMARAHCRSGQHAEAEDTALSLAARAADGALPAAVSRACRNALYLARGPSPRQSLLVETLGEKSRKRPWPRQCARRSSV